MTTKNLVPQEDGEGGIGKTNLAWGSGVFKTGSFNHIEISGSPVLTGYTVTEDDVTGHQAALSITESQISDLGNYITEVTQDDVTGHQAALSITESQISDLGNYITDSHNGDVSITGNLGVSGMINLSGSLISGDTHGRVLFSESGLMVGSAAVKPDPDDPTSIFFNSVPQVEDDEGNVVTILTADKLGLGDASSLTGIDDDIKFKLLTDQQRFVVGTTGEGSLSSGWYRFNDFKVKGATDIGAHPINPVDTRIYSDESSFVLFQTDTAGNRVAHLVGGDEEVSANNAIALGIAVKVDNSESPEDIEFVHTDGESYSVINGNSDSLGTNGLPIRQGFQPSSLGSNPSPLLIDGGSF